MQTPVILVTGVDPVAMATTIVSLQWDLPRAVVVRHHIDADRAVLQRTVSDATGVVQFEEIDLDHACVSCAVREDVLPTLARVADDPRWGVVIAHLPVTAEAHQVCTVLSHDARLARSLRISSVVTSLAGETLVDDLLGDDLLADRGLETSPGDRRGLGEVACGMVEYADLLVVAGPADATSRRLVRSLARPGIPLVEGPDQLVGVRLAASRHDHEGAVAWTDPLGTDSTETLADPGVWRVDLRSERAFDPLRLLGGLAELGDGRHRSRGCFWLPTRPGQSLVWNGAGGQLSVGNGPEWGRRTPLTRLVLTGVGTAPAHLEDSFERMLSRPGDLLDPQLGQDGFEPWLGPLHDVA